jgi:hypothetical protein
MVHHSYTIGFILFFAQFAYLFIANGNAWGRRLRLDIFRDDDILGIVKLLRGAHEPPLEAPSQLGPGQVGGSGQAPPAQRMPGAERPA